MCVLSTTYTSNTRGFHVLFFLFLTVRSVIKITYKHSFIQYHGFLTCDSMWPDVDPYCCYKFHSVCPLQGNKIDEERE